MKKFLSLMVCLTLVICSGVLFAACGKKDAPKPSFTVDEDIKTKATKIINELQTDVYNNTVLEKGKTYSYTQLKDKVKGTNNQSLLTEGYWVKAGKLANVDLDKVESITLGGVSYSVGGKFKLSVGNNNFVEDVVFTIDKDGNLSVAAPVVAFELQRKESKLKVDNNEFDFLTSTNAQALKLGSVEFYNADGIAGNDNKKTNESEKATGTNTYNLKVNSGDDYLLLAPNTGAQPTAEPALKADGKFLVRSVVDGKINSFGITGVDEGGLGIFFGRKEDNSVDPTIDGKKFVYDVYYTETTGTTTTSKAATFTFNVEVTQYLEVGTSTEIETAVKTAVANLQTNAYNKIDGGTEGKRFTYADLRATGADKGGLTALTENGYFVEVGKVRGTINSIKLGGFEYANTDDVVISIGKHTYIQDKAFVVEDGSLKIAAPVLAFELRTAEKLEVNGEEKDFITGLTKPGDLTISEVDKEGNNEIAVTAGAEKSYDLTIKDGNSAFYFKTSSETDKTKGNFVYRLVVDGKAQFGLSDMDVVNDGTGFGIYFGYGLQGQELKDAWNNKTVELGLYYVPTTEGNAQLGSVTLNLTVADAE